MTKHELSASGHDSQDIQHHNSQDNDLTVPPKSRRPMIVAACIGLALGIGIGIGLKALTANIPNDILQTLSSKWVIATTNTTVSEFPIYEIMPNDPAVIHDTKQDDNRRRTRFYSDIEPNAEKITITRDTIMAEIRNKPMTHLDFKSAMANPEKTKNYILEALENNIDRANSEDFIISIDDNLNHLQELLNAIDYKELFMAMKKKPKGREITKMAVWREMIVDKSKAPNVDSDYLCVNDQFYEGNSVLDPSLLLLADKKQRPKHIDSWIIWGSSSNHNVRFYSDFVLDSPVYIWVDNKLFKRTPQNNNPNGTVLLAKHIGNDNQELNENIIRGYKMDIIYGRLIPDEGKCYFVLSYRQFSLYDMRNRCHALEKYGATIELPF